MGSTLLYLTHALNGLLMIAMPVALGIFLTRRFHLGWRLFFIGAATFILSQVGHIPFNLIIGSLDRRGVFPVPPPAWIPVIQAVFLGLSAGLWEELFRYGAYRWWARDARSWGRGLLLGAGHGGIESIIFGVLVMLTYLNMIALKGADLSKFVTPDQLALAQKQVSSYWSLSWSVPLLGSLERLFALSMHLSCSILVLQVFTRRQGFWLALAIGWHALIDGALVYLSIILGQQGMYLIMGVLGLFALASLGIIFALRQPEPLDVAASQELLPLQPVSLPELHPLEETPENLDSTRYG